MTSSTNAKTPLLLMWVAGALAASAALADSRSGPRTIDPHPITVRFADLNLATPEGARALYGRIREAARQACGPKFAFWYPRIEEKWNACYEETVESAVKQVDRPMLTVLHERFISVASR